MYKNKTVKLFGLFIIFLSIVLIAWELYSPFYAMNYRRSVGLSAIAGNESLIKYIVGRIDFMYLLIVFVFGIVVGFTYYIAGKTQKEISKLMRIALNLNLIAFGIFIIAMIILLFITKPEIPILDPFTVFPFITSGFLYFSGIVLLAINLIQNKIKN